MEEDFVRNGEIACPYCYSVALWFYLVFGFKGPGKDTSLYFGRDLYPIALKIDAPPMPKPIQRLLISSKKNSDKNFEYELPLQIQKELYFSDLWTTYLNIIHYVISYNEAVIENKSWLDFMQNLPVKAHPEKAWSTKVGIYIDSSQRIRVILPENVHHGHHHIPRTNQWKNVCASSH